MFREIQRQERSLNEMEIAAVIQRGSYGVLSLYGDHGYPYGVPLHYVVIEDSIYFHCSLNGGHMVDAIKNHSKASFTVIETEDGVKATSVIIFGNVIEALDKRQVVLEKLVEKFVSNHDWEKAKLAIPFTSNKTFAFQMKCDHMSGKWIDKPDGK